MNRSILRISLPLLLLAGLGWPSPTRAAPGDFVEDDAAAIWHVHGQDGSGFGWAVAEIADLNGDGAKDALTSAPWHVERGNTTGLLVALSGRTGEELWRWVGEPGSLLGYAIADAGDVDGDGVHDIVAGAPGAGAGPSPAGQAYVYSGANGSTLLTVDGEAPGDGFGTAVASAGDIDGDGLADILVGAETADIDPMADDNAGRAYLVAGTNGGFVHTIVGPEAGGNLGSGTAFVGDLDGDGIPDPFIGARSAGEGGAAFVHRGSDGSELLAVSGGPGSGAFAWFFVATIGDVDGDATPDLYVGDFSASAPDMGSGRIHVFSGQDGSPLFDASGTGANQGLGPGRGAGDVDADGIPDVIAGSYLSSDGANQAGKLTWYSGVDGTILRDVTSLEAGEQLGFDVVGLGDVDRDGLLDALASGASGDNVYVIAGISFEDDGGSEDTGTGTSDTSDTSGTSGGISSTGGSTTDSPGSESGPAGTTSSTSVQYDSGTSTTITIDDDDPSGCGCRSTSSPHALWSLLLLTIAGPRRRTPPLRGIPVDR